MCTLATVDVPVPIAMHSGLVLAPPRPNPSPAEVRIAYALPVAGRVRITVHDLTGRTLATLCDDVQASGAHVAHWNGSDDRGRPAPAGIYVVRLESAGATAMRRIARVR
jgi:hypothetical protein